MSILNQFKNTANTAVEEAGLDQTQAQTGGGGGRLLPAGNAFARLVAYIEMGNHEGTGMAAGKVQPLVRVKFALWGKAPNGETYHNEDGTPNFISPFEMNLSLNEKAKFFKLFKKMNPKGDKKHMAQCLNDTYILPIVHTPDKKDPKKVYANADLDNLREAIDPMSYQPYNVPEIADESVFQLFLWDAPTQQQWDSLYIEGTNDEGKSRNFIQDRILGALNFPGSNLEQMLGAGGAALPTSLPSDEAAEQEAPQDAAPVEAASTDGVVMGGLDLPTV